MKCQKCGANNASTHVKTIINGEFKEYDLCSECAQKMGYTNIFGDMENEFTNFLGSFFGNVLPARTQATGCANCYTLFADELYPSIRRIHGNTTHCGKNSKLADKSANAKQPKETKEDKIKKLKSELDKAIKEQNFELAAELRDKIKEMEA